MTQPTTAPLTPEQERQWAMLAHLGGILWIPPALIIYLVFRDRGEFIRDQSREALNFQVTVLIAAAAGEVLHWVTGIPFPTLIWLGNVVLSVLAALAANRGERYRYPVALRLVS